MKQTKNNEKSKTKTSKLVKNVDKNLKKYYFKTITKYTKDRQFDSG